MARIQQGAFSAGILSEGLYARADTEKFTKGLRDALNVFVRTQGGVSNRAGTKPVSRFDISAGGVPPYLIPFTFGDDQTYMLEFGSDGQMRVIRDGAYLLDAGAMYSLDRVSTQNPARLVTTAAATNITVGDLVYVLDPNGTSRFHEQVVRVTSKPAGAQLVFEIVGNSTVDGSQAGWGTVGSGALLYKIYAVAHPFTPTDTPAVRYAQDADVLYMVHPDYAPVRLARHGNLDWRFNTIDFSTPVPQVPQRLTNVGQAESSNGNFVLRTSATHLLQPGDGFAIISSITAGSVTLPAGVYLAGVVTSDTVEVINPETGNAYALTGGPYPVSPAVGFRTPGAWAHRGPDVTSDHVRRYQYAVSAVDDNGMEGPIRELYLITNYLAFAGSVNRIGWKATPGAVRYNVYREDMGSYGLVGTTEKLYFLDENITPDLARTPAILRAPFSAPGEYPSVVSFYEQRLVLGATREDPQLVEMSRVGYPENFDYSFPALDDDALRFRLRAQEVNRISAFVPHRNFMLLTSRAEWAIAPQGDGAYQRPDRRQISPLSYYGCSDQVPPLVNGEVMIYCEPSGSTVRDFQLSDGDKPPGDLTVLARDLFRGRQIKSWAFSKAPHSIVWVVLDNGEVVSMTYVPEHDIWAWTRHQFGGHDVHVCQVAVVREGHEDAVYFVVRRDLFGQPVTLTERLAERKDSDGEFYFVDCGAQYDFGSATRYVDGLLHLRGSFLSAVVDGDVVERLPVDEFGTVDLGDNLGRVVSIGLPYEARIQTLDVVFNSEREGSSEGRFKSISEVAVRYERSRGLEVGTSLDRMAAFKEWDAGLYNLPIPAQTRLEVIGVDSDWVRNATLFVRQRNPLPMTVNSLTPVWEFSD